MYLPNVVTPSISICTNFIIGAFSFLISRTLYLAKIQTGREDTNNKTKVLLETVLSLTITTIKVQNKF